MESLSIVVLLTVLAGVMSANFISAANSQDVIINEVAWMGTENSANDEWIELRNNTSLPINLNGWILKAADGTPTIKLAGSDPAHGFYLLERTDDNTVLQITADQIYTGALSNQGEKLELFDSQSHLIDSADYLAGWLAGDNSTKQTMERKDANAWQTSQNPGGTPKAQNSQGKTLAKTETPQTQPLPDNNLAATSESIQQIQNEQASKPLSPALIASVIAIFSSAIVLVLKNKAKIG